MLPMIMLFSLRKYYIKGNEVIVCWVGLDKSLDRRVDVKMYKLVDEQEL